MMGEFETVCKKLRKDIDQLQKKQAEKKDTKEKEKKEDVKKNLIKETTYLKNKDAMHENTVKNSSQYLARTFWKETGTGLAEENQKKISRAILLLDAYEKAIKQDELKRASIILEDLEESRIESEKKGIRFQNRLRFPDEINQFMEADLNELEKAFNSTCYRSAIIICGRLLETALHRKFYEKTGNDILEKHPEIGLGKIIAKLEELNVQMPPGLTQQIHLINQARIYSVHKKKEAFLPSQEQAYAVILFTIDTLKKLL